MIVTTREDQTVEGGILPTTSPVHYSDLDDEIIVLPGVEIDLLPYLATDEYEVTITDRYGMKSYTLSYHGTRSMEARSNEHSIWGLTLVIDKHMQTGRFNRSIQENPVLASKVTRRVSLWGLIEIGTYTVFVGNLKIKRVLRG